jgi:hypothetical protein
MAFLHAFFFLVRELLDRAVAVIDRRFLLHTRNVIVSQVLQFPAPPNRIRVETIVSSSRDESILYAPPSARGKKFYAVRVGTRPGIYSSWTECEPKVKHFSSAQFCGFKTLDEVERYLRA